MRIAGIRADRIMFVEPQYFDNRPNDLFSFRKLMALCYILLSLNSKRSPYLKFILI